MENDNLRVALQFALGAGRGDALSRLAVSLWPFWETRGYLGEGGVWLGHALSLANGAPPNVVANLLLGAGTLAYLQGDYTAGGKHLGESLALFRTVGDRPGMVRALNGIGRVAEEQRDFDGASRPLEESIDLARELGHKASILAALNRLGNVEVGRGDNARAKDLFAESLSLSRDLQDKTAEAVALANIAGVLRLQGDLMRAGESIRDAIVLLDELGDKTRMSTAIGIAAMAASGKRQWGYAVRLFAAAEALSGVVRAPINPVNRAYFAPDIATARDNIGRQAFEAAWTEGISLTYEQAVAAAVEASNLKAPGQPPPSQRENRAVHDDLTRREREVVRLLALGYTDRQVAEALVITEGTAGVHVHHILEKLGLRSRAQVTDWARATGLLDAHPG